MPGQGGSGFRMNLPGVDAIRNERMRQMVSEGWSPEHDDSHVSGELAYAAAAYAFSAAESQARGTTLVSLAPHAFWPWADGWKPGDAIRDLTKAGALIAAEIDRLKRLDSSQEVVTPSPTSAPATHHDKKTDPWQSTLRELYEAASDESWTDSESAHEAAGERLEAALIAAKALLHDLPREGPSDG